jgi:hypothetical protein
MDDVSGGKWEVMLQPRVTWVACGQKEGRPPTVMTKVNDCKIQVFVQEVMK